MINRFFEVFHTLNVGQPAADALKDAVVEEIFIPRDGQRVRITIMSPSVIDPDIIRDTASEIRRQIFDENDVEVEIFDRYELKENDPQGIFSLYEKNLTEIISERSIVLKDIYDSAGKRFEDDALVLDIRENPVLDPKTEELAALIRDTFSGRLGLVLDVRIVRTAPEGTGEAQESARAQADDEISRELNRIIDEYNAAKDAPKAPKQETEKYTGVRKAPKKVYPNHKDIIYGRSFDDSKVMPVKDIQEGIGEIVIKGKVIDSEVKDIKNDRSIITFAVTDSEDTITAKIFADRENAGTLLSALGNVKKDKGAYISL
ncbi:MAG: hypothetical protein IJM62_06570, partial [Lachnospiraceae bacterium]|nr:hypothetical protein [Lachnospiraceae bacterium]